MKYLITGLGNTGPKYENTRHNIGFDILDALARASGVSFEDKRYGSITRMGHKGRILVLLKPSTFVNRSGRAVHYWIKKEKVPLERLLVAVDDIALPFGTVRLRPKGGDGGHNGLYHINQTLGSQQYARIRFGIGNGFPPGRQADYVLSPWKAKEREILPERIEIARQMILSFTTIGLDRSMSLLNPKGRITGPAPESDTE